MMNNMLNMIDKPSPFSSKYFPVNIIYPLLSLLPCTKKQNSENL